MICNNNYLADILRVCEIKALIWVMRFKVLKYISIFHLQWLDVSLKYIKESLCLLFHLPSVW